MIRAGKEGLIVAIAICAVGSTPLIADPPPAALMRGPYLQIGSESGVVVRWRTDRPAPTRVLCGLAPDRLDRSAAAGIQTTEPAVLLADLEPETTYFYAIGTEESILSGGDPEHRFRTPPAVDS